METASRWNPRGNTPMRLKKLLLIASTSLFASTTFPMQAMIFPLPPGGDSLVGREQRILARHEDTLIDIGQANGLGYEEIINANPGVDSWLPGEGTPVVLPHLYLLPDAPRKGIVINVAEMRLYYYPKDASTVESFPISVGRSDWHTPITTTKIVRKTIDPVWYPPASIKREHAAKGDPLPDVVPAGPDNPLGKYALYLGASGYLLHGTNNENGIGMQVTHGCMRLYAQDVKRLFENVPIGTPVQIVNQPYKAGWREGVLYVEIHPLLEGASENSGFLTALVKRHLGEYPDYPVDWQLVEQARIESTGLPVAVGPTLTPINLTPSS